MCVINLCRTAGRWQDHIPERVGRLTRHHPWVILSQSTRLSRPYPNPDLSMLYSGPPISSSNDDRLTENLARQSREGGIVVPVIGAGTPYSPYRYTMLPPCWFEPLPPGPYATAFWTWVGPETVTFAEYVRMFANQGYSCVTLGHGVGIPAGPYYPRIRTTGWTISTSWWPALRVIMRSCAGPRAWNVRTIQQIISEARGSA